MFFVLILSLSYLYSLEMILIKPEEDTMKNFYISETPITQELFSSVMGYNPSFFKGESLPVETISFYEARVFCNKLSIAHQLQPVYEMKGNTNSDTWAYYIPSWRMTIWTDIRPNYMANGYRLVSTKEWDYLYERIISSISDNIEDYAWVYSNSNNQTHSVGTKMRDRNGLFDFLGNVTEWKDEQNGDFGNEYFYPSTIEEENFFNSLSYRKFHKNEFMVLRNHQGLYNMIKNSMVGLRVVRMEN